MKKTRRMQWFKIYHEFFNDVKLKSFTAAQMFAVTALLNQASQSQERGTVLADEDDLAVECRITVDELRLVVAKLLKKGIIERLDGGALRFIAWRKRQPISDEDPTNPVRQQRFRDKQKAENQQERENVTRYESVTNGIVTALDKIREEKNRIDTLSSLHSERDIPPPRKAKKQKPKEEELELPFSGPEFANAWQQWHEHRMQQDAKKWTTPAQKAALRKLEKLGEARALAAIEHSLANGWLGIFEPKPDTHERSTNPNQRAHGNHNSARNGNDRSAPTTESIRRAALKVFGGADDFPNV